MRLDYLLIPVGLKLRFGPVYAMGGVYGAYRLSANVEGTDLGNGEFTQLDFGTYAGAGFKVLIFSINAKYNWGLSDVSNGKNGDGMDVYNRFFSISLGVGIP